MTLKPNPNRIREILAADRVREAAETILSYRRKEVFHVLALGWGIALVMVFTLLLLIRIALALPLPWHG